MYKKRGNDEYGKKNFINAIHFYTEGIKVDCKDDELNAKLYNNRATAHFYLGRSKVFYVKQNENFSPRLMFMFSDGKNNKSKKKINKKGNMNLYFSVYFCRSK